MSSQPSGTPISIHTLPTEILWKMLEDCSSWADFVNLRTTIAPEAPPTKSVIDKFTPKFLQFTALEEIYEKLFDRNLMNGTFQHFLISLHLPQWSPPNPETPKQIQALDFWYNRLEPIIIRCCPNNSSAESRNINVNHVQHTDDLQLLTSLAEGASYETFQHSHDSRTENLGRFIMRCIVKNSYLGHRSDQKDVVNHMKNSVLQQIRKSFKTLAKELLKLYDGLPREAQVYDEDGAPLRARHHPKQIDVFVSTIAFIYILPWLNCRTEKDFDIFTDNLTVWRYQLQDLSVFCSALTLIQHHCYSWPNKDECNLKQCCPHNFREWERHV